MTVKVTVINGEATFRWANAVPDLGVTTHDPVQTEGSGYGSVGKWMSAWTVQVPEGYSVLYTQPLNRTSLFQIFSGVVDSGYQSPVNFPFVWTGGDGEFELDPGTPIAQLIPFKTEEWEMSLGEWGYNDAARSATACHNRRDGYRRLFHRSKKWK